MPEVEKATNHRMRSILIGNIKPMERVEVVAQDSAVLNITKLKIPPHRTGHQQGSLLATDVCLCAFMVPYAMH